MILSRKLSDALNEQINMEMWSSNLYLSMSVHFTQIGLDGFAHWTLKQSQEELMFRGMRVQGIISFRNWNKIQ